MRAVPRYVAAAAASFAHRVAWRLGLEQPPVLPPPIRVPPALQRVYDATLSAIGHYRPARYDGSILLIVPEVIDPLMADGALGGAGVFLDELADGESVGAALFFRQSRYICGRARQLLAEQGLHDPVPAQHGAGPRRPGLFRLHARKPQHAAATILPHASHSPPL